MTTIVRGYCPMGCGETLVLEAARIKCIDFACPNPEAVHRILDNRETEHVVRLDYDDFSVKHPLRERIEDELFECPIFKRIAETGNSLDDLLLPTGTYRVYIDSADQLQFERIPDREESQHA